MVVQVLQSRNNNNNKKQQQIQSRYMCLGRIVTTAYAHGGYAGGGK